MVLLVPLVLAAVYEFGLRTGEARGGETVGFAWTIGICLFATLLCRVGARGAVGTLYRRESILLVVAIWLLTAAVCAVPFRVTGAISRSVDAYFESMSGLTTTGATILHAKAYDAEGREIPLSVASPLDPAMRYTFYGTVEPVRSASGKILKEGIEALGKPLLFWRSFLQWLGGMGIVVLFIAVLPALSMGGRFLFETEVSGVSKEGMTPRIRETASLLWKIYLVLTVAQVALLMVTGPKIPLFDAVTLAFGTISTGGFAVQANGIAAYAGGLTYGILALFMILGSLNFSLYFYCLRGKFFRLHDPELFLYLGTLVLSSLLMTLTLWGTPKPLALASPEYFSLNEALAYGSFQAVSAQTSTGWSLFNYDLWPFSSQILMLILMFIGGMSGSTTGGIKVFRYAIVLRTIRMKIESLFRPEAVRSLTIGSKEISEKTATSVLTFFCLSICLVILGVYLLVAGDNDPVTSLGVISCMINNTGLPFGGIGCAGSFAYLSTFSKSISIIWMVLGRLEYFAVLVLLVPSFWRSR
jgi:trk system potassium uptake protein TrkH